MLVRNLTQGGLSMKGINGKKLTLPPLKVVEIDALEFPAERLKRLFGRYVHILTEKVGEVKDEVPAKFEENLELEKGNNTLPTTNETITKEKEIEDNGDENSNTDIIIENSDNDDNNVDKLVDDVLKEIENEDAGKEETITKEPAKKVIKAPKKSTKKASKK